MPSNTRQPTSYRRFAPVGFMFGASGTEALIPLVIAVTLGVSDALLFGIFTSIGLALGAAILLATLYRTVISWPYILSRVFWRHHIPQRHFLFSILGRLEYPAFVLAATQIGVTRTSIIWGIFPMLYILFLDRSTRTTNGQARYQHLTPEKLVLLGMAFVGLAFVVSSQPESGDMTASNWSIFYGVLLACFSTLCASLNSFNILWGIDLGRRLDALSTDRTCNPLASQGPVDAKLEAASTIVGVLLATTATIPILILATLVGGEFKTSFTSFSGGLLIGVFLLTPAVVLVRLANLQTDNLGVNAIGYLTPVFSIAILAAVGRLGDVRPEFIVIGVTAIVAVNLFLNFNPEQRLGFNSRLSFRTLVMSFWMAGVLVYMKEDWLDSSMVLSSASDYWGLLAVTSTMFVLILSFRITRLHARTTFEETHTALVFRKLERLIRTGIFEDDSILRPVARMDSTSDPQVLAPNYQEIRNQLRDAHTRCSITSTHSHDLAEVEGEIDALVLSKQYGREFAELVAVVLLGVVTVAIATVGSPFTSDFMRNLFSVVFSATIAFLIANLIDLRRERDTPFIQLVLLEDTEESEEPKDYQVLIRENATPLVERVVSIVVAVGTFMAFGILLYLQGS